MTSRPFQPADLKSVIAVYHDAIHGLAASHYSREQLDAWAPAEMSEDKWRARLAGDQTLIMESDGEICGFASYEMNGHLDFLFTHPRFARQGVATHLCEQVEGALTDAGVTRIFTEASLAARAFFEDRGYRAMREETVECRGMLLRRFAMEKQIHCTSRR
jgi:putative acetyltransferase